LLQAKKTSNMKLKMKRIADKLRTNIREIRIARALPQRALADELDLDVSAVCNFENGKRDLRMRDLPVIAAVLGVEVIDLFTWPNRYVDSGLRLFADPDGVRAEWTQENDCCQTNVFDKPGAEPGLSGLCRSERTTVEEQMNGMRNFDK